MKAVAVFLAGAIISLGLVLAGYQLGRRDRDRAVAFERDFERARCAQERR